MHVKIIWRAFSQSAVEQDVRVSELFGALFHNQLFLEMYAYQNYLARFFTISCFESSLIIRMYECLSFAARFTRVISKKIRIQLLSIYRRLASMPLVISRGTSGEGLGGVVGYRISD